MFSIYQMLAVLSVATSIFSVLAACDQYEERTYVNDLQIIRIVRKIIEEQKEKKNNSFPAKPKAHF